MPRPNHALCIDLSSNSFVIFNLARCAFSDRLHREEEALLLISDYVDLLRDLIRIARDNGVKDKVIDNLLNQRTKYHGLSLRSRLNRDIVEGRFDIDEIVRIEEKNDEHTISDKTF